MRKIFMSSVAATGMLALAACGGEQAAEAPAAADEPVEAAVEEVVEEAAPEEVVEEVAAVPAAEANGTIIEVEMLTRDPDTGRQVFKPGLVRAKVGDTIVFKAVNPTHLAASIDEMLPAGVTGFEGKVNEEVAYVVPAPGIYGYKCTPHYAAGMVGLIVVEGEGMMDNLEAAKSVRHVGMATRVFDELFAQVEA